MKTEQNGYSARNINTNKLANPAKSNFILKLFYILFMLTGIQFAYAGSVKKVTISFNFLYGAEIESVYFDQTNMGVQNSVAGNFTVTDRSSATGYTLTVKTDVENGANSITKNFNNESQRMEVGGSATNASSLDFLFDGILEINGRPIGGSRSFTLAHENYKSSNSDWWIADTSGNASLYGNGTSISMTVKDDLGNYYCLNQGGGNYQVLVTLGQCTSSPSFTGNLGFTFVYGSGINSIEYDNSYNADLTTVGNITTLVTASSLIVNINGNFNQGLDWEANAFNNAYNANKMELATTNINAVATDAYIAGTLKINGKVVATDFALAHEYTSTNWWIATNSGSIYQPYISFSVADLDGKTYCLIRNDTNYQILVKSGSCTPDLSNPQYNAVTVLPKQTGGSYYAILSYNKGNYDDSHNNIDYFQKEQVYNYVDGGATLGITSNLAPDAGIASSFNNKLGNSGKSAEKMMKLGQSTKVTSPPAPTQLDYWFETTLFSQEGNGTSKLVASDLTFALDPDGKTWWVGSKDAQLISNDALQIGDYCLKSKSYDRVELLPNKC